MFSQISEDALEKCLVDRKLKSAVDRKERLVWIHANLDSYKLHLKNEKSKQFGRYDDEQVILVPNS